MGVHDGHRQRVLTEYLANGMDNLLPHKVLEMLLFFAIPRRDVNAIAHALLNKFGTLSGVFNADIEALTEVEGIGPNAAALIHMIPDLSRRYFKDSNEVRVINNSDDAVKVFIPYFIGIREERVYIALLDAKGKVISVELVSSGTLNRASVDIRKIVALALSRKAVSVVMAHNHPDGVALPSSEDIIATKMVYDALKAVDIPLEDHLVIAEDDGVSVMAAVSEADFNKSASI